MKAKRKAGTPTRLQLIGHHSRALTPKGKRLNEIKELLEGLPDGQGMLTRDMAERLNLRPASFQTVYAGEPCLKPYRCKVSINTVWANPRTIEALERGEVEA